MYFIITDHSVLKLFYSDQKFTDEFLAANKTKMNIVNFEKRSFYRKLNVL